MIRIQTIILSVTTIGLVTLPLLANDKPESGKAPVNTRESKMPLVVIIKQTEGKPSPGKLQFAVEIVNKTNESVKLTTADKTPPFTFKIIDSQNQLFNAESFDPASKGATKAVDITFAPQEKKVYSVTYDGPKTGSNVGMRIPAGTYKVSILFPMLSYVKSQEKVDFQVPFLLKSKEIEISVPKADG